MTVATRTIELSRRTEETPTVQATLIEIATVKLPLL